MYPGKYLLSRLYSQKDYAHVCQMLVGWLTRANCRVSIRPSPNGSIFSVPKAAACGSPHQASLYQIWQCSYVKISVGGQSPLWQHRCRYISKASRSGKSGSHQWHMRKALQHSKPTCMARRAPTSRFSVEGTTLRSMFTAMRSSSSVSTSSQEDGPSRYVS